MASTRTRGQGDGASTSHATPDGMFVTKEEEDWYFENLRRPLVEERKLLCNQSFITEYVGRFGWEKLVGSPVRAVKPVVCEFYANFPFKEGTKVMVRGKQVKISVRAITRYYGLEGIGRDDYGDLIASEDADWNTLMSTLVTPGTELGLMPNWRNFPRAYLTAEAKVWYHFICGRLMPTVMNSEVLKKRAVLLYTILSGQSVDVGRLILGEIRLASAKHSVNGSLGFPSLITGLCIRAGVEMRVTEEMIFPSAPIAYIPPSEVRSRREAGETSRRLPRRIIRGRTSTDQETTELGQIRQEIVDVRQEIVDLRREMGENFARVFDMLRPRA